MASYVPGMTFTPESRIIASFTLVAAFVVGAWGAVEGLVARSYLLPSSPTLGRVVVLLVTIAATAVAYQATRSTQVAWAKSLGGAAVLLGLLATLAAAVHVLSNV